jgi:hypothetical protein
MTSYRGTLNPVDGRFRIREVTTQPSTDRRKLSVGRVASCISPSELYHICLSIGVVAPRSTPVTREVATTSLTAVGFDSSLIDDDAVQRCYDLRQLSRQELVDLMQRYFELHDLIDA